MRNRSKTIIYLIALMMIMGLSTCDTANDFDKPYQDYFLKYFGGDGDQMAVDMVVNADGSVVMVGKSEVGTSRRIYFVRADGMGNVINATTLGGNTEDVKDIEPLGDGRYIILSDYVESTSPANVDIKLILVSAEGVKQDSATFGFTSPFNDYGSSVTVINNGDFIVTGRSEDLRESGDPNNTNPDLGDIFLHRFSASLELQYASRAGTSFLDGGIKYFDNGDNTGGVCFAYTKSNSAVTDNPNPNNNQVLSYLNVTIDGIDNSVLNSTPVGADINNFNTDIVNAVSTASFAPGYFITGTTTTNAGQELFICKMRKSLNFINDTEFYTRVKPPEALNLSGVKAVSSIVPPEGYLVVANDARGAGNTNIWLSKIDVNGNIRWSASFGSDAGLDTAAGVQELSDGRILVLGTMQLGDKQKKMVLIKLNARGELLR